MAFTDINSDTITNGCGHQFITLDGSAVALTVPAGTDQAIIQVQTQPVRCWWDGTNPTGTQGFQLDVGNVFRIIGAAKVAQFRMILDSQATLATGDVAVCYERLG